MEPLLVQVCRRQQMVKMRMRLRSVRTLPPESVAVSVTSWVTPVHSVEKSRTVRSVPLPRTGFWMVV